MKYIDEKRMRFGYVAIFGLAVVLIGGALWDLAYNEQRAMTWFISGLGGLLILALLFFLATELILRDALDLSPRPRAVSAGDAYGPTPARTAPVRTDDWGMKEPTMSVASALEGSLAHRIGHERSSMMAGPGPSAWSPVKMPTVSLSLPPPVVVAAQPAREDYVAEPRHAPRPKHVPPAPRGIHTETMSYEQGNPEFRVARGFRGSTHPGTILESTRILCMDCGVYFRVDLDRTRPISVQCPHCHKDLGLSGALQSAPHLKMRCRHCGDFVRMPRVADHKATQCATCGQFSG